MRCSYRVAGVTLALLWLFQASAVAGIYKWRDDQGKLHFTDSKSKIPLKYRENIQKFKGVVEPKVEAEAPAEESETPPLEEGAEKAEDASASAEKAEPEKEKIKEVKKPEPEPMDPQTVQAIKLARTYLKDENFAFLRVFLRPYEDNRAKKYVATIKSMIEKKTKTIKQLKGFKLKSIKKTRSFLTVTLVQDRRLEKSEDTDFLKGLRAQVLRNGDKKKQLIKKLLADLPPGEDATENEEVLIDRIFNKNRSKKK
jgi:hypothetical protein